MRRPDFGQSPVLAASLVPGPSRTASNGLATWSEKTGRCIRPAAAAKRSYLGGCVRFAPVERRSTDAVGWPCKTDSGGNPSEDLGHRIRVEHIALVVLARTRRLVRMRIIELRRRPFARTAKKKIPSKYVVRLTREVYNRNYQSCHGTRERGVLLLRT